MHPPPRGSTEVTRSQRAHSRLHERIPCNGANQQRRQCMQLPNTESNATGLIDCPRMPTLGHGRDAICRRPQELWRNPPPSRTSIPIPQSGPRALPRECTLRVTPCEGAFQGWYGGPAPPQAGKTQEADRCQRGPKFNAKSFKNPPKIVQKSLLGASWERPGPSW